MRRNVCVALTLIGVIAFVEPATGASPPGKGFGGNPGEGASGLIAMGARHYDPATGRFLQTDPLGFAADQLYAYGAGNPYLYWDPTGLSPKSLTADYPPTPRENLGRLAHVAYDLLFNVLGSPSPDRLYESELCLFSCVTTAQLDAGGYDLLGSLFKNVGGVRTTSIGEGPFVGPQVGTPPMEMIALPGTGGILRSTSPTLKSAIEYYPDGTIFDVMAIYARGNVRAGSGKIVTYAPAPGAARLGADGYLSHEALGITNVSAVVKELTARVGGCQGRCGVTLVKNGVIGDGVVLDLYWSSWINAQNPLIRGNVVPSNNRPLRTRLANEVLHLTGRDVRIAQ